MPAVSDVIDRETLIQELDLHNTELAALRQEIPQGHTPTLGELVLIFVNLLFLMLAAVRNTVAVRTEMQRARRLMRSAKPTGEKDGKPVSRA